MAPPREKSAPPVDLDSIGNEEVWRFLFSNVHADPKGGAFRVFDQRLLVLRPEALVDLQKHLEDTIGLSSKGFLYLAGEKSARAGHNLFVSPESSEADPVDATALLRQRIAPLSLLGWGRFDVSAEDASARLFLVTLGNSAIAEAYGESKKPVCHLLAGWIAGTSEAVLDENLLCEETVCRSQGKPRCEFHLRPTPYG